MVASLERVVTQGLFEEGAPEWMGTSAMGKMRKHVPGRGNSKPRVRKELGRFEEQEGALCD